MSSQIVYLPLKIARIVLLLTMVLLLWGGGRWWSARAEPTAGYDLSWWTVAGGGGPMQSGSYSLTGTIGQPETGEALARGNYSLESGFWHEIPPMKIFLPVIVH